MFSIPEFNELYNEISFEISDVDLSVVNGIRRIMEDDIPMIGFAENDIHISKNNTPINNEMLQNRIALIPIHFNEEQIENFQECSIEIDVSHEAYGMLSVTTDDFVVKYNGKIVKNTDLFPHNKITKDPILITKLRRNEHIKLEAKARIETGGFNASFTIVSACRYFFKPLPPPLEMTDIIERERHCDPNVYVFVFELINSNISHGYVFHKAITVLEQKLLKFKSDMESFDMKNTVLNKKLDNMYEFVISDEDDTLGNVIQSHIYNNFLMKEKWGKTCIQCGYICEHPLDNTVTIGLTLKDETDEKEFKLYMANCINDILDNVVYPLREEWSKNL
jgi:DNA-directed RNA polymerase subunit L